MLRRFALLCCMCVCVVQVSLARAAASEAARSCPGAEEFQRRLEATLELSECHGVEHQLFLRLDQESGVSGTLVLLEGESRAFVREVRGETCVEVEEALTLALEVHLDERAASGHCPAPDSKGSPRAATSPQNRSSTNLDTSVPAPPRATPSMLSPQPLGMVSGVLFMDTSNFPTVGGGLELATRLRLTPNYFMAIAVGHQTTPPFSVEGPRDQGALDAVFNASVTGVAITFGQRIPLNQKFEFTVSVGPRIGLLTSAGGSFPQPAWQFSGALAAIAGLGLGAQLGGGLQLGLQAGGVLNLTRARFLFRQGELAWEQPWGGVQCGAHLGAAFN